MFTGSSLTTLGVRVTRAEVHMLNTLSQGWKAIFLRHSRRSVADVHALDARNECFYEKW